MANVLDLKASTNLQYDLEADVRRALALTFGFDCIFTPIEFTNIINKFPDIYTHLSAEEIHLIEIYDLYNLLGVKIHEVRNDTNLQKYKERFEERVKDNIQIANDVKALQIQPNEDDGLQKIAVKYASNLILPQLILVNDFIEINISGILIEIEVLWDLIEKILNDKNLLFIYEQVYTLSRSLQLAPQLLYIDPSLVMIYFREEWENPTDINFVSTKIETELRKLQEAKIDFDTFISLFVILYRMPREDLETLLGITELLENPKESDSNLITIRDMINKTEPPLLDELIKTIMVLIENLERSNINLGNPSPELSLLIEIYECFMRLKTYELEPFQKDDEISIFEILKLIPTVSDKVSALSMYYAPDRFINTPNNNFDIFRKNFVETLKLHLKSMQSIFNRFARLSTDEKREFIQKQNSIMMGKIESIYLEAEKE